MSEIHARIGRCFSAVFTDLGESDLPRASQSSVALWDSVAHVTLLSAVAEEFAIELDDSAFDTLTSYQLIVRYVEDRLAAT